jgi:hypothetical protein
MRQPGLRVNPSPGGKPLKPFNFLSFWRNGPPRGIFRGREEAVVRMFALGRVARFAARLVVLPPRFAVNIPVRRRLCAADAPDDECRRPH